MGWKRRSRAASFSRYLRYSSRVVAPMVCSSPRASLGLRMLAGASPPPAAPPPPRGGGCPRPLGRGGAGEGGGLVDEQRDVAAGADLLEHLLEALLEVPAVARAGHPRPEVEGVELLVLERLGPLTLDDPLGQPLDDGGLADARLADQHGVVLGPPGEDLHDPLDLLLAADHRVELALAGRLGEVAAELVEDQGGRRGALAAATGGALG